MQIYPTTSNGNTAATPTTPTTTNGMKTLGQNDFLKLISTQMQAQDPLSPMKDTDFIAQMANFTSLEQMKNLSASFDTFIGQQRAADAQGYLGKTVTVNDPELGSVTGTVDSVTIDNGLPNLVVGGKAYEPSAITEIKSPASSQTNP